MLAALNVARLALGSREPFFHLVGRSANRGKRIRHGHNGTTIKYPKSQKLIGLRNEKQERHNRIIILGKKTF